MTRRNLVKEIFQYMKKYKKQFILAIFFLTIFTSLQLLTPALFGYIVDNKLSIEINNINIKSILILILSYFILGIFQAIFRYLSNYKFYALSSLMAKSIREDLYKHIQKLPMSYYDNISVGNIVTKITNDTNSFRDFFETALAEFLTSIVFIILTIIFLSLWQAWALLFIIVPMPIIFFLIKLYDKKSILPLRKYRKSLSGLNSNINENIQAMEVIRTNNIEDNVYKEFKLANEKNKDLTQEYNKVVVYLGGSNITNMLQRFSTLVILLIFLYMNVNGNYYFTAGLMYILVDYTERIYTQVSIIMHRLGNFEHSMARTEQIFEIFAIEKEKSSEKKGIVLKGDVEFKDVSFYYKDENYVLNNISFKITRGKSVALIGDTGSGKSSIINLIFRFYIENKGEILFDNVSINNYSIYDLRDNMAIVLQEPFIYNETLRYNISLGEDYSDEEILNSLISVGGKKLFEKQNNGLDEILAKGGNSLSQGEKQIVTFARAIIRNPKILILDEATSSIDTETESYIQIGLNKLKKGRTTFTIAHRLSTIKDSDLILVLKNGRIIERGNHQSLIEKNSYYKEMLEKESRED